MKILVDRSMRGLEGGECRLYKSISPSLVGRMYKEPHWIILERIEETMDMFLYNTIKDVNAENGYCCDETAIKKVYEILHNAESWNIRKIEQLLENSLPSLEEKNADIR